MLRKLYKNAFLRILSRFVRKDLLFRGFYASDLVADVRLQLGKLFCRKAGFINDERLRFGDVKIEILFALPDLNNICVSEGRTIGAVLREGVHCKDRIKEGEYDGHAKERGLLGCTSRENEVRANVKRVNREDDAEDNNQTCVNSGTGKLKHKGNCYQDGYGKQRKPQTELVETNIVREAEKPRSVIICACSKLHLNLPFC